MRILPLLAAATAISVAACDAASTPPNAKALLAMIYFHVDPVQPDPNIKMPAHLNIEKTSDCHYKIDWDYTEGLRYSYTVGFSPNAAVRFQPDPPGYRQHIDGAGGILNKTDIETRRGSQEYGQTYDDLMANYFLNDGMQATVTEAMRVFLKNYCSH